MTTPPTDGDPEDAPTYSDYYPGEIRQQPPAPAPAGDDDPPGYRLYYPDQNREQR